MIVNNFIGISGLLIPVNYYLCFMANKYTKTPNPPKEELELLYNAEYLSQVEIGERFNVSQKIVFRWFRDLEITSRKPFKRNQLGSNNSSWKGNDITYAAAHYRVVSKKGRPTKCEVCGTTDESKVYDWACVGDYMNIDDYKRMCRSCHWKHDKIGNNFPNHKDKPSNTSKNVKRTIK